MNITLDDIRSKAPPTASHYINHNGLKYYRLDKDGIVYIYNNSGFGGYECLHLHISETVLKPL